MWCLKCTRCLHLFRCIASTLGYIRWYSTFCFLTCLQILLQQGTEDWEEFQYPLAQGRNADLGGCNSFLLALGKNGGSTGLRVDSSKGDTSNELKGLFTNARMRRILDRKDYVALDMLFNLSMDLLILRQVILMTLRSLGSYHLLRSCRTSKAV